jgi:hypothetical protein
MTKIEQPIPDEIMEQARALVEDTGNYPDSVSAIATALLAAEKRGEEKERERCVNVAEAAIRQPADDYYDQRNVAASIAAAIRRGS